MFFFGKNIVTISRIFVTCLFPTLNRKASRYYKKLSLLTSPARHIAKSCQPTHQKCMFSLRLLLEVSSYTGRASLVVKSATYINWRRGKKVSSKSKSSVVRITLENQVRNMWVRFAKRCFVSFYYSLFLFCYFIFVFASLLQIDWIKFIFIYLYAVRV